ncbi:hypothetical protein [Blautia sp. XA-2221]|uniref:hypothetical protein n=1 Tax=Blautia sp. XA-2221 TaxID=2903961 RepID=UPI0023781813|nr:hypothetical protein [Blautia sp. XA-2221]
MPHKIVQTREKRLCDVGRLLGLMLFCIGIGMVIGMLIAESVIIVIAAGLCLLCGYHMFCR